MLQGLQRKLARQAHILTKIIRIHVLGRFNTWRSGEGNNKIVRPRCPPLRHTRRPG